MNWKVFVAILLLPTLSVAQELPPVPEFKLDPIPPGEDIIQVLRKGQGAPFDGLLFDNSTALRLGNYVEQARLHAELCYKTWRETREAEQVYWRGLLEVEQEASEEVKSDLRVRLERVEEENARLQGELSKGPPWYNTRTFGVVLGATGTAIMVVTGAVLINAGK